MSAKEPERSCDALAGGHLQTKVGGFHFLLGLASGAHQATEFSLSPLPPLPWV